MFAYGQLSDLKDGRLVTPLRKNGNYIECRMPDGRISNFSFKSFDFDKTIEERNKIDIEIEEDTVLEISIKDITINTRINDFVFIIKEKLEPNFYWTRTKDKLIFSEKVL